MSENIRCINADEFEKEVIQSLKPVMVEFYSEGCPPCQVLSPIYQKLNKKYGKHIKFVKILRTANKDFGIGMNVLSSPTVLFYENGKEVGSRLSGFMNKAEVRIAMEKAFGHTLPSIEMKRVYCDLVILGAGVAGLSAAIYASRAKLKTILIDESVIGGQASTIYHIENYPGTKGIFRGKELVENMREQAISFGTIIEDLKEISDVDLKGEVKYVKTEDAEFYAKAAIIASGAEPRTLPAENADIFKGRGIHYCATCDAPMYQDKKIVVVGGGNSAVEGAILLTKFASQVTIIHQFNKFQASIKAIEEALNNKKINVILNSEVRKVNGGARALTSVVIENLKTKEFTEFPTEGAFVYIGTQPKSEMYKGQVEMNDLGYIVASEDTKTNVNGVFVAGDIRTKNIRQVITAASDGAVSGIMAERYIFDSYQQKYIFNGNEKSDGK